MYPDIKQSMYKSFNMYFHIVIMLFYYGVKKHGTMSCTSKKNRAHANNMSTYINTMCQFWPIRSFVTFHQSKTKFTVGMPANEGSYTYQFCKPFWGTSLKLAKFLRFFCSFSHLHENLKGIIQFS